MAARPFSDDWRRIHVFFADVDHFADLVFLVLEVVIKVISVVHCSALCFWVK